MDQGEPNIAGGWRTSSASLLPYYSNTFTTWVPSETYNWTLTTAQPQRSLAEDVKALTKRLEGIDMKELPEETLKLVRVIETLLIGSAPRMLGEQRGDDDSE